MPWGVWIVLGLQALALVVALVILVFVIINRVKKKKIENFEKRDN